MNKQTIINNTLDGLKTDGYLKSWYDSSILFNDETDILAVDLLKMENDIKKLENQFLNNIPYHNDIDLIEKIYYCIYFQFKYKWLLQISIFDIRHEPFKENAYEYMKNQKLNITSYTELITDYIEYQTINNKYYQLLATNTEDIPLFDIHYVTDESVIIQVPKFEC